MQYHKNDIFGLRLRCPSTKEVIGQARELLALPVETMCSAEASESVADEALHCLLKKRSTMSAPLLKRVANLLGRSSASLCLKHTLALGELDEASKTFPDLQDARIEIEATWQLRCRQSFLAWKKLQTYHTEFTGHLKGLETVIARLDRARVEENVAKEESEAQAEKFAVAKQQWSKFSTEMQAIVVQSRKVKDVLGVIPAKTKQKLEDAKERLDRERKGFKKSLREITECKKKQAVIGETVERLLSEKQTAQQVVAQSKEKSSQVKVLVDRALELQDRWTEALKLELAKRERRKQSIGEQERDTRDTQRTARHAQDVFEGLVKVKVNGKTVYNYREAAKTLTKDNQRLQEAVATLQQECRTERTTVNSLNGELAASARALETTFHQAEQKHKKCVRLEHRLKQSDAHSAKLEAELDAARQEITRQASQAADDQKLLASRTTALTALHAEGTAQLKKVRAELAACEASSTERQTELQQARSALEQTERVLQETRHLRELDQASHKNNAEVLIRQTNELASSVEKSRLDWFETKKQLEAEIGLAKRTASEADAAQQAKDAAEIESLGNQLLAATQAYDDLSLQLDEAHQALQTVKQEAERARKQAGPDVVHAFSMDLDLSDRESLRKKLITADLQVQADMELMMRRDSDLQKYILNLERAQSAAQSSAHSDGLESFAEDNVQISTHFADLNREINHLLGRSDLPAIQEEGAVDEVNDVEVDDVEVDDVEVDDVEVKALLSRVEL